MIKTLGLELGHLSFMLSQHTGLGKNRESVCMCESDVCVHIIIPYTPGLRIREISAVECDPVLFCMSAISVSISNSSKDRQRILNRERERECVDGLIDSQTHAHSMNRIDLSFPSV